MDQARLLYRIRVPRQQIRIPLKVIICCNLFQLEAWSTRLLTAGQLPGKFT